jgi:hypothetical protein
MKKIVVIGCLIVSVICISISVKADEPKKEAAKANTVKEEEIPHSKFCAYLDDKVGFARCETSEVICYKVGTGGQCYAKPAPKSNEPSIVSVSPAVPPKK